ncbi:MAG: lysophospholipase L1-like esterase [Planctomycetota bacterium]|jgi:lysophospholipase L1-like esterase
MNDFLTLGGIAVAIGLLAEFGMRFYLNNFGRAMVWQPNSKLHMHMDQDVLPELETLVRSEANSLGERGDEIPTDKDSYRILVIGGSAAECFYLDKDSGWPGVTKSILNQPENLALLGKEHVHLGNVARAGVGAVGLEKMLDALLPQYDHIDLVLCMVGASDILRWFSRGAKANDDEPDINAADYMAFLPSKKYSWHPKKTALASFLRHKLKSRRTEPEVRENTGQRVRALRKMRGEASTKRKETGDPTRMLDRFAKSFRRILVECSKKSSRVVVVRQPWFEKEHTEKEESFFWNAAQGDPFKETCDTYFDTSMIKERMRDMDNRAAQIAEDLNIQHIDLMPHLDMSRATFYDFYHYTPEGARKLGEVVAKEVLAGLKQED